jgi:membrane-bound serine protease (ClpP class)
VIAAIVLLGTVHVAASFAVERTAPVVVAHLTGPVDPVSAGYLHRAIKAAEDDSTALLIITVDTPGGLDSSMRVIVQDLLKTPVPSVVFVYPPGARANSEGRRLRTSVANRLCLGAAD